MTLFQNYPCGGCGQEIRQPVESYERAESLRCACGHVNQPPHDAASISRASLDRLSDEAATSG